MSSILSHVADEQAIKFNYDSGFYDKTLNLKLTLDEAFPIGSKIYYTLDGNNPTIESQKYNGKIELRVEENTKVYPVKAIVYYKGEYSNIYSNTYVMDKNIEDNDISIISITSDNHNLYDYEYGIMVPGITYDKSGGLRGNYNNRTEEWLRNGNITMFDKNGINIINNDVLIGISGGTSSKLEVKSFKIKRLAEENKFEINFYNDDEMSNTSFVNEYNNLRLRSGATDLYKTNIRSSVISRIMSNTNFDGFSTTSRAIIFLNGEFYGITDIQQSYSSSFLTSKFSLADNSLIRKYKYKESAVFEKTGLTRYFTLNLDEESNRNKLEEKVDMDNFLLYYAVEILTDNFDWPQNNFEIWNYIGGYDGVNKYTDGKFRFLFYDADYVYDFDLKPETKLRNMFTSDDPHHNSVFKNVVTSKYYRDKFVMLVQDLLNTSFNENKIIEIIDEEFNKVSGSYNNFFEKKQYDNYVYEIGLLKDSVKKRNKHIVEEFKEFFDLEKMHCVNIKSGNGIQINFTNQELYENEKYTNDYYVDIDLTYNYKLYPGYKFKYWLVNGKKIYDEQLIIDERYKNIDEINIEAVAEYDKNQSHLIISEISAKDDSDWIKIVNIGKENIDLKNYYLSDDINKPMKYQLPNIILKENESIIINGSKNYYAIGDYICNFNLSSGEILSLHDNINTSIDSLIVPRMSNIETYGRYLNSNTYKFFTNINNERKKSTY